MCCLNTSDRGPQNSPLSGLLSLHAPLIHFHLLLKKNTEKEMSNLKYYMSKCVQSKLSITQLSLESLFYLGERALFLFSSVFPFLPLFLIYYHACIISCQPQLSVHLSLCFLLSPVSAFLRFPFLYPHSTLRCFHSLY